MTSTSTRRIAIGLSGGIDSSVAAALLQDQGWEVIGLTLHMFKEGSRCCSLEDVQRAQRVCEHLGIRHYTLNVVDEFLERVIKPFADEYARGRTPNPCIFCNRHFKFGTLVERARQLGCSHVATGHYVRVERRADGFHLRRGVDPGKDQSYFLHRLTQDQLSACVFPLGDLRKDDVRRIASEKRIPTTGMRETADLCFITAAGPAPLIERFHPEVGREGPIVDDAGREVGRHAGIHHFTIGQREGLRVAAPQRLYVRELRPDANTVVVSPRAGVLCSSCRVADLFWQTPTPPSSQAPALHVRIRYQHPGVAATLRMTDSTSGRLEFAEPQFAVTPGQAAVFYDGDEVLGGAWIDRTGT
jgi:tRNA-specific 2-thiouridylase